jgi:diguanylate cyclase (GGDEF)-like protein
VDWIARFGGDEFVVVLPETTVDGGRAAAERFSRIIRQRFIEIGGENIHLSATFGVTGFDRASIDESIDLNTLIGIADRCLYEAKEREKGTVHVEPWRRTALPAMT